MKARWNGQDIANSDDTIVVESNHYFPRESLVDGIFSASEKTTHCPWKGDAHYLNIEVDGRVNQDAAWYYPQAKTAAAEISGRVAFWRGVEVIE